MTSATDEWPREDRSHRSASSAACDSIRVPIRDLGVSELKTNRQITEIRNRQDATESTISTLQLLIRGLVTSFEYDKPKGLAAPTPFMVRTEPTCCSS